MLWRDDMESVRRVLAGDREALLQFVTIYERVAQNAARKILGRREEDIEECVRGCFVSLLYDQPPKLSTWRDEGVLEAWLYRVVYNQALKMRKHPVWDTLEDDHGGGAPGPHRTPEEEVCARAELAHLLACVEALPPRHRRMIKMAADDFPCQDIAEHTGEKVRTVYAVLHRARKILRRCLDGRRDEREEVSDEAACVHPDRGREDFPV